MGLRTHFIFRTVVHFSIMSYWKYVRPHPPPHLPVPNGIQGIFQDPTYLCTAVRGDQNEEFRGNASVLRERAQGVE